MASPAVARRYKLGYQTTATDTVEGRRMSMDDELLQERREMWHRVTRVTIAGVVLIALILLLMLIFLT